MRFFLAGIMQGSHRNASMHNQDYRGRLKNILLQKFPNCEVYDPLSDHKSSLDYDKQKGFEVFMHHNRMCAEVDVVLACIPEASMGTAIEMWEAHRHGRLVVTISPLAQNWAVKFLSHMLYPDEEAFLSELENGSFAEKLAKHGVC